MTLAEQLIEEVVNGSLFEQDDDDMEYEAKKGKGGPGEFLKGQATSWKGKYKGSKGDAHQFEFPSDKEAKGFASMAKADFGNARVKGKIVTVKK